jgi:Lrp/AsnC family transcriptional regulator, leucine-responsive regulatory protein
VLDPAAMGRRFLAYVTVGLSKHTKSDQSAFEKAIARALQVRECYNVTGTIEYISRVEAEDTTA